MAYTLKQLQDLEAQMALGAARIKTKERDVEYRTLEEMRALAAEMRRALGINQGTLNPTYVTVRKGLET